MSPLTLTEEQRKMFKGLVEKAAERALAELGLDGEQFQRLIGQPGIRGLIGPIAAAIRDSIEGLLEMESGEVWSDHTYPLEYEPRPIKDQVMTLAEIFGLDPRPALRFAEELPGLPKGAEGWFAIPRWQAVSSESYNEALQKALDLLRQQRGLHNQREGRLGGECLRQEDRTIEALEALAAEQEGSDILVLGAQLGLLHRGRSVRRTRELFGPEEFGLDTFGVAGILLTHPRRLRCFHLGIYCAGDKYAPLPFDDFWHVPYFDGGFEGDEIVFGTDWNARVLPDYGAATGFLL